MQKGSHLEFDCLQCQKSVTFSIFQLDKEQSPIICSSCQETYLLDDEILQRQIKKFIALCHQIRESEEILGNTCVGINVEDRHVKIPYKLLLSRLNSTLDLAIGDRPLSIRFRFEPKIDLQTEG